MKSKSVFILLFGVVFLGLGLGFVLNINIKNNTLQKSKETTVTTEIVSSPTSLPKSLPTITFPPLSEKVKSIDSNNITISGGNGEMIIPRDPSIVKLFKRSGDRLIPGSFEEIEIGQKVTLKIIKPGKEAELIIE